MIGRASWIRIQRRSDQKDMASQAQAESGTSAKKPLGEAAEGVSVRWSLLHRIALRFGVVYFLLFTLWIPVHFLPIPPIPQLYDKYRALWHVVIVWVAQSLLHVQVDPGSSSKDSAFNYVQLFCYLWLAAGITVVWSLLDRRRANYERLQRWFWLYLRLVLGITMIQYGAIKVFPAQFPAPSLTTLLEPFGDSSPMHLLWTFMGASPLYTFFAGAAEVVGGVLLLIPRTTTLGALVSLGALGNVLMLNLSYDVPVKIGSSNLILMSVILLWPDLRRLVNFFFLNRRVEPAADRSPFRSPRLNRIAVALQVLFAVVLLGNDLYHSQREVRELTEARRTTPLYGIWSVEEFTLDGEARPPLLTDPLRWRRLIVEGKGMAGLQLMSGPLSYFDVKVDPAKKSFVLSKPNDWMWRAELAYENPQPDRLILRGQLDGHPITATLRRFDQSRFLLLNRGFHWINESSLNQ
jgi:uncharacterized membrane protein YphA (DoxX/SURF4 family)